MQGVGHVGERDAGHGLHDGHATVALDQGIEPSLQAASLHAISDAGALALLAAAADVGGILRVGVPAVATCREDGGREMHVISGQLSSTKLWKRTSAPAVVPQPASTPVGHG